MSRIEEALKKLQTGASPAADLARATAPPASKKKVQIESRKHHVDRQHLIRAGLLAPAGHARSVIDEFRRVKRPLIDNAVRADRVAPNQNVIMIASGLPGAGKTFCAVNLAVSISLERELNVLLVDADIPKPQISQEFGLSEAPGLIDLLHDDKLDVSSVLVRTDLNDIQLLPAGRQHPQATELLASERMSRLMKELSMRYPDRIILIDSPPLLVTSEAQALASQVGQIALVVEAGRTSRQALRQAVEILDPDKAVNVILNKTRNRGMAGHYGGDYTYDKTNGYGRDAADATSGQQSAAPDATPD
jgi:protein-tyrosine kinase